jgi:hypothetical protein
VDSKFFLFLLFYQSLDDQIERITGDLRAASLGAVRSAAIDLRYQIAAM